MRSGLLALLAALALVVAACGNDSEKANEYVSGVNQVSNNLVTSLDDLRGRLAGATTDDQAADFLDQMRVTVTAGVKDLKAIEPPKEVTRLHSQLARELAVYGPALEAAAAAYRSGDAARILKARTDLVTATTDFSTDVNGTIGAINRVLRD